MNISEQPWLLLTVAGLVLLFVIAFKPQRYKWQLLTLSAVFAIAAFAIDYFIKTDKELVEATIADIVRAAQNEDVEAIKRLIADNYHDSLNKSRRELLMRLELRLDEPLIEKNVLRILSLNVAPPKAKAVFTVRVVFDPQGPVYDFRKEMLFKLEADLVKQGDTWYFSRLELVEVDTLPMDWQHIQSAFSEAFG